MTRARNFCVTYNNYKKKTLDIFKSLKCIKYAIFGKEVGESGTPHLQGYVQLNNAKTITAFQKILKKNDLHCSVFVAKGNWEQNCKYCSKDENVTEFGVPKKQGKRTDLEAFYADIKAGKDVVYLQENHTSAYVRYYKAADRMRANLKQKEAKEWLDDVYSASKLRIWQKNILTKVEKQSERTIDWVVNPKGNIGKTWLAKYLVAQKGAFYVQGGKTADIAYAFENQEYVVFDFTKSQREFVNYTTIEAFKNGLIFSPKYESKTKIFKPCKVLCLSNWTPDLDALSQDRWRILTI